MPKAFRAPSSLEIWIATLFRLISPTDAETPPPPKLSILTNIPDQGPTFQFLFHIQPGTPECSIGGMGSPIDCSFWHNDLLNLYVAERL